VSPRLRAALFAAGALVCAGLSAALAGTATSANDELFGALRDVAVTRTALAKGTALERRVVRASLESRQVPADFAPPDVVAVPEQALGRRVAVALPPGSYLTASALAAADGGARNSGAPRGTTPLELAVTGAGALAASRVRPGARVDVVVSGVAGPGPGGGRAYVAAEAVVLLALRKAPAATGLGADRWVATLAVVRDEALRLIRAEDTARSIRLLAR
jgi:hypothetical protein